MELAEQNFKCLVSQIKASDCSALQNDWLSIQSSSLQSCFLSWEWISAWLQANFAANEQVIVVQASKNGFIVGLAIFSIRLKKTFLGKRLKQLWLNRTGCEQKDQIWIEHNDFLTTRSDATAIRKLMFNALLSRQDWWDEIFIGLSTHSVIDSLYQEHQFMRELIHSPSFSADISQCSTLDDYLQTLSKNTRSQLNRSRRGLDAAGKVSLTRAETEIEKRQYLSEISTLHIEKWGPTLHGSGFSNSLFVEFHENIIFNDTTNQYSRLYKLSQNGQSLGYVYLLLNKDIWSFYLSAIEFHSDPKIKIGLVLHSMIIEEAIQAGVSTYDFLAGDAQYKKSLTNSPASDQKLVCFYQPTLYMRFREQLRKLKRRFQFYQGSK